MRDIFARADQVVIWLGEENEKGSTAEAFEIIPILAKLDKNETWKYVEENMPLVLRPAGDGSFLLIGEWYVSEFSIRTSCYKALTNSLCLVMFMG
jgi:hypothetical protein